MSPLTLEGNVSFVGVQCLEPHLPQAKVGDGCFRLSVAFTLLNWNSVANVLERKYGLGVL